MASAWLRRCCCCCCPEGEGGADSAGLLHPTKTKALGKVAPAPAPAAAPDARGDVYAVRHISRFGRAESKETLHGWVDEADEATADEGAVSSDPRGAAPSPTPASAPASAPAHDGLRRATAAAAVEAEQKAATAWPGLGAGPGAGNGQHLLRPQRLPKELALSTPDLARLSSPTEAGARSARTLRVGAATLRPSGGGVALGASSVCLPRLAQRSSRSSSCTRRSGARSDSMESVDLWGEAGCPAAQGDDVFAQGAPSLARALGLDMSLYSLSGGEGGVDGGGGDAGSQQPLWTPGGGGPAPGSGSARDGVTHLAEQPRGSVAFTASYFHKNKKLSIQLNKLENLPPKGMDGVYDVVVRLCVLPSDKQVKTSKILKGSLSPLTEEDFSFKVKDPVGKVVRFSVFNALLQGKYDAIGHALFNIEDVMSGRSRRYTMKLTHQSQLEPTFGSLQIYLQLSQERLVVDTIQARNLSANHMFKGARSEDKFSTYVKITFYCAGEKVKSKKSPVVTGDRNPRYEYSCDFKILSNCIEDCYLVLNVVMKVNLRKDITLGRYIFGPYFFTESRDLTPWGRMVVNKEEVHHWFHLYL